MKIRKIKTAIKNHINNFTKKDFIKNHLDFILISSIILVVVFMSIGYSVLNSNLNISGELTYRPQDDIRIIDFVPNGATDLNVSYADFSKKEVKIGCTPTTSGTATYKVTVKNKSSHLYVIQKVDMIGESKLTYQLEEYELGDPIMSGQEVTFTVKFTYTADTAEQSDAQAITLSFDFVKPYAAILIYNNENSPTTCETAQCALDELYEIYKVGEENEK